MDTPSPGNGRPAGAPTTWQRTSAALVRAFHTYATWLVGISWKRFFLLSLLLLTVAGLLSSLPPFTWTINETITEQPASLPKPPKPPKPPRLPSVKIDKPGSDGNVEISIGEQGIRIIKGKPPAAAASAASAAEQAASAAEQAARAASAVDEIKIEIPAGAGGDAVREAMRQAREEIQAAIEEARQNAAEAQRDAEQARQDAEQAAADVVEAMSLPRTRVSRVRIGDFLPQFALLWILGSMIIKITYKSRMQAEVKAAQATEVAESESLKRQVVEARMAAMQAQVEPHFLFNTLASIDHLIETDPSRASTMQKNLIALLRASMPTMRETKAQESRDLGRELAVIRPYLEILKVRMEERLRTEIAVPDGLLSAEFPSMMLQSLVENAIKHGLEPKPEGGLLRIAAEVAHGKLQVTVADTGLGFGKAATAGTGVGLANIRERLQLLYGHRATLAITENPGGGTVVTISLPYTSKPQPGDA